MLVALIFVGLNSVHSFFSSLNFWGVSFLLVIVLRTELSNPTMNGGSNNWYPSLEHAVLSSEFSIWAKAA